MLKTGKELASAMKDVAQNHKTIYVLGSFGWPMTAAMKKRAKNAYTYNKNRASLIDAATADTFGFDCICLIKALLWGWAGDASHQYGGAKYQSNGVPDIDADQMIKVCKDVSTDFSKIQVGEYLWMKGHCGIYIGDGLCVECTPIWKNGVQVTAVVNIGAQSGYSGRRWTSHGKLPYVTYDSVAEVKNFGDCTVTIPVLKKGALGKSVKAMQTLLIGYGYSCGSSGVDGDFGSATDSALRSYQKDKGLEVDGACGPLTWNSLLGK